MKDWSALEEAAGALRRLNRAVASRDVADEALRQVARVVDGLADGLGARPLRDNGQDMATLVDLAAAMAGRPLPVAVGDPSSSTRSPPVAVASTQRPSGGMCAAHGRRQRDPRLVARWRTGHRLARPRPRSVGGVGHPRRTSAAAMAPWDADAQIGDDSGRLHAAAARAWNAPQPVRIARG